jgi:signal peptidase I
MTFSENNPQETTKTTSEPGGFTRFRKEWLEPILIAVVMVVVLKTFIVQNFKIPSGSMEDTLLVGDRLFASKFIYGAELPFTHFRIFKVRDPRPGDVIVFKYPEDPTKDYIKRCIAVAGQTVEIRNKQVYVDDVLQKTPETIKYIDDLIMTDQPRDNMPKRTVPTDMLFAMGDNRDNSYDSRYWGFVPYENLIGKALFIYWSVDPNVPVRNILHKFRWNRMFEGIR